MRKLEESDMKISHAIRNLDNTATLDSTQQCYHQGSIKIVSMLVTVGISPSEQGNFITQTVTKHVRHRDHLVSTPLITIVRRLLCQFVSLLFVPPSLRGHAAQDSVCTDCFNKSPHSTLSLRLLATYVFLYHREVLVKIEHV